MTEEWETVWLNPRNAACYMVNSSYSTFVLTQVWEITGGVPFGQIQGQVQEDSCDITMQ